jgi:hypothetical protein
LYSSNSASYSKVASNQVRYQKSCTCTGQSPTYGFD